jgi:hypothetical protein
MPWRTTIPVGVHRKYRRWRDDSRQEAPALTLNEVLGAWWERLQAAQRAGEKKTPATIADRGVRSLYAVAIRTSSSATRAFAASRNFGLAIASFQIAAASSDLAQSTTLTFSGRALDTFFAASFFSST